MQLHGDEQVVNTIIERKMASGEFKEHPDAPDDPTATLYHVMVELSKLEEDQFEERMDQTYAAEVHGEQVGVPRKQF